MRTHRSNQLDYVENDATEIDHGPHWSSRRVSLGFMPPPVQRSAAPLPPPPLPLRTAAVGTPAVGSPAVSSPTMSPFVMVSHAVRAPHPPPLRAPTAFYSYAEHAARQHLDTERVAPLPMSDLEDPWLTHLHGAWQRYAAPALGLIAALIFVVGYLAYSSQTNTGTAASAALAPTLTMPVVVAPMVTDDSFNAPMEAPIAAPRTPTVPEVSDAPSPRTTTKRMSSKKRVSSSSSSASKNKRRPVRIDSSTPLGNLRPSRY